MKGYNGRDLVGPKEQIEDIRKIAKQKALKNRYTRPQVAKEHQEVYKKATDSIKKENVSSKPKTSKELKRITKKASKGKVDARDILPDFKDSLKNSAIYGAIDGATFGGGISAILNIKDLANGKKSAKGDRQKFRVSQIVKKDKAKERTERKKRFDFNKKQPLVMRQRKRYYQWYALGMSYKDIAKHIEDIYRISLSIATISNITDKKFSK